MQCSNQLILFHFKLMGGQLIKGYSIQGDSLCTTGVAHSWKLYKAQNSSNHNSASIFLIQKKHIKRQDKEQIIKISKRQSTNLLRIRHPGVLAVIESLVEDQNVLAFVCQKVEGNMSLLMKNNRLQEFISSELQLKLFLYPFIQTLQFIHSTLKQVHLAISLDSIFVTSEGKWKIGGFGHNQVISIQDNQQIGQKLMDLSFSAPEVATQGYFSKKSDIFSLGIVILKLLEYIYKIYKSISLAKNEKDYNENMKNMTNIQSHPILTKTSKPFQLKNLLKGLLAYNPSERYTLEDLLASEWMNDSTLITVKCLDKINSYQSKQQLEFLKGLAGVLDDFPDKVLIMMVIPKLLDLIKYNNLIASIVFIITDLLKKKKIEIKAFRSHVWSTLKTVTQAKQTTAQAIYLFVAHYQILEQYVGESDMATFVMPLYIKCFDCPAKLKQLALSMIPKIIKKSDSQFLKTKILPKMMGLLKDQNIQIRKDTLKALYGILNNLDTQTISLTILPGLQIARKAGTDSFINAIIGRMYNLLGQTLQLEVVSSKILPTLIPYLTDPSTTKVQFAHWKKLIYQMIERIQKQTGKQYSNDISELPSYNDNDFKLSEVQIKVAEQKKGNYNFLYNYATPQKKQQQITNESFSSQKASPLSCYSQANTRPTSSLQNDITGNNNMNFSNDFFSIPKQVPRLNVKTQFSQKSNEINLTVQKPPSPSFNFDSEFGSSTIPISKPSEKHSINFKKQELEFYNSGNDNTLKKDSNNQGWSGPGQTKKLKGPTKPQLSNSPSSQHTQISNQFVQSSQQPANLWSYERNNKDTFAMNFSDLDNLSGVSSSKNPKTQSSYNPASVSSDNPFAEIEASNPNLSFHLNMNMAEGSGINSLNSDQKDIYKYFEVESINKPKESLNKSDFDLI